VGLRSSVAGTGVLDDPGREVPFEGVDRGLEHAAVGVDAADVEVGPAMLVDELGALLGEQRVDVLVDHWTLPDVGREFRDEVGVRCVGHCGPADEPLVGAAGVVEVAGEYQVAANGLPAAYQLDDDGHDGRGVLGDEPVLHVNHNEDRFELAHLTSYRIL